MTRYNGTKPCSKCGKALTPTHVVFGGPTGLCHSCRNEEKTKLRKNRMSSK